MNPVVQKYVPPVIVLCAAAYLGWPPAPPLDLGEDVVRISSVQWRPSEIEDPPFIRPNPDPFGEVLVIKPEMKTQPETGKLAEVKRPVGPRADELQSGLLLSGIAETAGKRWAVINGRPRLGGDVVTTSDGEHVCRIIAIQSDHVVVQSQQTVAEIRPSRNTRDENRTNASTDPAASAAPLAPESQSADVPPPPVT